VNPGDLNHKVVIESITETSDSYGGIEESWSEAFKRWANVRPIGGREPYINDQNLAELDLVVTMRYDSSTKTITPKHRLKYKDRYLQIESIVNVQERDEELRVFCREYVGHAG